MDKLCHKCQDCIDALEEDALQDFVEELLADLYQSGEEYDGDVEELQDAEECEEEPSKHQQH